MSDKKVLLGLCIHGSIKQCKFKSLGQVILRTYDHYLQTLPNFQNGPLRITIIFLFSVQGIDSRTLLRPGKYAILSDNPDTSFKQSTMAGHTEKLNR